MIKHCLNLSKIEIHQVTIWKQKELLDNPSIFLTGIYLSIKMLIHQKELAFHSLSTYVSSNLHALSLVILLSSCLTSVNKLTTPIMLC